MKYFDKLRVNYKAGDCSELLRKKLSQVLKENKAQYSEIVVVCIGTDRSTGDSLGPIVGSLLKKKKCKAVVYGTLEDPVHAMNLKETVEKIKVTHKNALIIAVDACLGRLTSVGCIDLAYGPIKPGAGVNKELGEVGDFHISGIVNAGGFMEYFVLQGTRLSVVMSIAEIMANCLINSINKSSIGKRLEVI